MTLLTTVFAAIICTVLWYKKAPHDDMKLGLLCYMYWGASIMWFVDAIFEYAELKAEYFAPSAGGHGQRPVSWPFRRRAWAHRVARRAVDQRPQGRCQSILLQEEIKHTPEFRRIRRFGGIFFSSRKFYPSERINGSK